MHPLNARKPYPFNQWWVAAFSSEVGREILGRTILGERVILYRTEDGEAVALSGICPHRAFPLEKSCLEGSSVRCGYHGFTFGPDGACTNVPSQSSVPTNSDLRRYPLVERGDVLWIWTGNPALADEAMLPDIEAIGLGAPGWRCEQHPLLNLAARHPLVIDNLLDLSHVSFIHSDTIPAGDKLAALPVELVETEESLNVRRVGRGLPSNPFFKLMFPHHDGPVDQVFDAEYIGPHLVRTGGTIYNNQTGEMLGTQNYLHLITPETPHSFHYFLVTARDFAIENEVLSKMHLDMGQRIGPQDAVAMEAIEQVLQTMDANPREVSARVDTGALKVRKRLADQINAEAAV